MITLKGRPVSPGFARGCAHVHSAPRIPVPRYRANATTAQDERRRFEDALRRAAEDLARMQRHVEAEIGQAEAEIFDAHLGLLHDRQFLRRIGERIERERVNAEWAVDATVSAYAQRLLEADSEYLRERAADSREAVDLARRMLARKVVGSPHDLAESH